MALKIRLARGGAKKRPFYSVVVADARAPRDGRYVEKIGTFNPLLPRGTERVALKQERVEHWLSMGAKPTERVSRIIGELGIRKYKPGNNPEKGLPGKKAQERAEEKKAKMEAATKAEKADETKTGDVMEEAKTEL